MSEETNRIAEMVPPSSGNGEVPAPPPITLDGGIIARMEGELVRVCKGEVELFRFPANACPFDKQPLSFLVQVYSVGYQKGRVIGSEVAKARIRDLLGVEL